MFTTLFTLNVKLHSTHTLVSRDEKQIPKFGHTLAHMNDLYGVNLHEYDHI